MIGRVVLVTGQKLKTSHVFWHNHFTRNMTKATYSKLPSIMESEDTCKGFFYKYRGVDDGTTFTYTTCTIRRRTEVSLLVCMPLIAPIAIAMFIPVALTLITYGVVKGTVDELRF